MIGLLYKDMIYMKKMWKTVILFAVGRDCNKRRSMQPA